MHYKKRFRLFHIFLLIAALLLIRVFYYSLSDGFTLTRIEHTFSEEGLTNPPITRDTKKQLEKIFQQPFHYLGKGSQAYAFISEDKKYVLKLFKYYHLKPVNWLNNLSFLPHSYREEQIQRREKKRMNTLTSYCIARDLIPNECALIYLQIVPSKDFHQTVTFTDKIGRSYTLDIANYGFMVQKTAELIFPTLEKLLASQKEQEAQAIIKSIIQLMVRRSQKGIQDQDPDLHKNAGLIDKKAYCIDIGGFHCNTHIKEYDAMQRDITRFTRRLYNHLIELNTPSSIRLANYLDAQIQELPHL